MDPTTSVILGVFVLLAAYVLDLKAAVKHLVNVPRDVERHDKRIRNRDDDLATWIADDAKAVADDIHAKLQDANQRGLSSGGAPLQVRRKVTALALHRYRDQHRDAERVREDVALEERWTHAWWRWIMHKPMPALEAPAIRADVIADWESAEGRPPDELAA